MAALEERPVREWTELCQTVKELVPSQIGENVWEVIIAAALITSPEPQLLAQFYSYLVEHDPSYNDTKEQNRLSLRLRDTMLKLITLVGAPQVLCALVPLAKAQRNPEEKAKSSILNPKWAEIDVLTAHARGMQTMDTIYGSLLPKFFQTWGEHSQDVQFNTLFAVYGIYLSDNEVMTPLETEAIAFTTIFCTGLREPSMWHMRGMGRLLGARGSDDETTKMRNIKDMLRALKVGIMAIVDFVGEEYARRANLGGWVNVGDVARELGGWGDDK